MDEDSSFYSGVLIGGDLPPHIGRGQERIQELMNSHIRGLRGRGGPVWLAWWWALTGTVTSPVTMQAPSGNPPSRAEILEEINASAPGAISSETGEQIELARQVLAWLIGETEDPPASAPTRRPRSEVISERWAFGVSGAESSGGPS